MRTSFQRDVLSCSAAITYALCLDMVDAEKKVSVAV